MNKIETSLVELKNNVENHEEEIKSTEKKEAQIKAKIE